VREVRLAREEGRLIGNWLPLEQIARQGRVELLAVPGCPPEWSPVLWR
jgi:hypothetical protein